MSAFLPFHIPRAQNQSDVTCFVDEKDDRVTPCITLSPCGVYIFTWLMSRFNKAIAWSVEKDFLNLVLGDLVFDG